MAAEAAVDAVVVVDVPGAVVDVPEAAADAVVQAVDAVAVSSCKQVEMKQPRDERGCFFVCAEEFAVWTTAAGTPSFATTNRYGLRLTLRSEIELGFAAAGDGGAGFAIGGAAAFSFALIPKLFAFREGEFDFDLAIPKVHARRDESVAFLPRLGQQL